MTAVSFFNEFKELLTEDGACDKSLAKYGIREGTTYLEVYRTNEPGFTYLVNKKIIDEIVHDKENDIYVQHEYFRIDTTGWKKRYKELNAERAKALGLNRHLWDLEIAVEHENNHTDWLDELIKLIHIRCPLKVVIGYTPSDTREHDFDKLNFAAECMNKVRAFENSSKEEYLIILGNCAPKDKKSPPYSRFDYRGYLYQYDKRNFEKLKDPI